MFRPVALAALLPLLMFTATASAQVLEHRQVARQSKFFQSNHPTVRGDTISLNGSYVRARWNMTMEDFLAVSEEETAIWLRDHLRPGGHISHIGEELERASRPMVYIIIDIEHQLHPKDLWKYWSGGHYPETKVTKQEVADAFAMRLRVLKQVINTEYPDQPVKVGLFSTLHPSPAGWPTDSQYLKRLLNLTELASLGMLDDADFLVPVLFARYVSTHARHGDADRYVMQGLDGSSQLRRSDGSSLPMMPLLSVRVYGPDFGRARVTWLDHAIDTIRTSGHDIEAIGFWASHFSESDECLNAYFDRLFSPQDWNFDCVSDEADDALMSAALIAEDPMSDLNRDGYFDEADWDLYRAKSLRAPATVACGAAALCPCPVTFFDFLQFQEFFAMEHPDADMNGDGVFDFFDFILFQQFAENPCP